MGIPVTVFVVGINAALEYGSARERERLTQAMLNEGVGITYICTDYLRRNRFVQCEATIKDGQNE